MAQEPERLEHRRIKERQDAERRIFVAVAGVMMVAAITFGLLNSFNIIHM